MALALVSRDMNTGGIMRVIKSREGDIAIPGFVDTSQLYIANHDYEDHWKIGMPLKIKDTNEILEAIQPEGSRFIGLEDPDIIDTKSGVDIYFTIPFLSTGSVFVPNKPDYGVFLGHASGNSLDNLVMKQPVLSSILTTNTEGQQFSRGFKELCPSPMNSHGFSYHLVESHDLIDGIDYSTIAVVRATSNDGPWEFIADVIHPALLAEKYKDFSKGDPSAYNWCGEHASPCRLLPSTFVDSGRYMVGIMNGRSPKTQNIYGRFLPGLFLYDINRGEVVWVDPQPLFDDPGARTIVFASDFILPAGSDNSSGTLLAHIDDSRVYSYEIMSEVIYGRLPKELVS